MTRRYEDLVSDTYTPRIVQLSTPAQTWTATIVICGGNGVEDVGRWTSRIETFDVERSLKGLVSTGKAGLGSFSTA